MMPFPAKVKNETTTTAAAVGDPATAAAVHKVTAEEQRRMDITKYAVDIYYSDRYSDDDSEYRHVSLPEGLRKYLPNPPRLMTETEWRGLGVRQSPGWEHYMVHEPEPHVLLFRRQREYHPSRN
ncbi:hypothetical protein EV175_001018 [Coemansia sp. RSA 1933]|nr:hypothetical protein EV175_001018 [Coemansia sp. RSA 1933]